MDLITREELGDYLGEQIIEDDIADQVIGHVSRRMARFCDRDDWGGSSSRTEYLDGGSKFLMVRYWPITSVTNIWDDPEHEWATNTVLASDDYWIAKDPEANGHILLDYTPTCSPWSMKVTYTGGYSATGSIPQDLKTAALMQCKTQVYQMQTTLGNQEDLEFLAEVKELLVKYKRSRLFA